jgi:hypothetical protein
MKMKISHVTIGNITAIPIYGEWPVQVDISQMNYRDNLYQWREAINGGPTDASLSSLQGFTLFPHSDPSDSSLDSLDVSSPTTAIPSQVPISGLNDTSPIFINIPLASTNYITLADCRFWNESALDGAGNWSTDGCQVYSRNLTYLVCACTHLTIFNSFLPKINIPKIPSADDLLNNPEGWISMISIWVVFGMLLPLMVKHDRERSPIALSSYVEQHSQLVKTGTVALEDGKRYQPGMTRYEMKKLYKERLITAMREEHSWFAAFHRHPLTGYSSVEQLTMCFLFVFASMAVAGFFFGIDDGGDIIERIKAAVFTSLLMIPLGTIVNYLLSADPAQSAPFLFVQSHVAAAELTTLGIKYDNGQQTKKWNATLEEKKAAWKKQQKLIDLESNGTMSKKLDNGEQQQPTETGVYTTINQSLSPMSIINNNNSTFVDVNQSLTRTANGTASSLSQPSSPLPPPTAMEDSMSNIVALPQLTSPTSSKVSTSMLSSPSHTALTSTAPSSIRTSSSGSTEASEVEPSKTSKEHSKKKTSTRKPKKLQEPKTDGKPKQSNADHTNDDELPARRSFPLCCLRVKPVIPQFEYRYTTQVKLHEVRADWHSSSYYRRTPTTRIIGYIWAILMMIASSGLIIVYSLNFLVVHFVVSFHVCLSTR